MARLVGFLALCIGQPRVVGEMVAGIILGPSILGSLVPLINETFNSMSDVLYLLSQLGLALYMFVVGLELDHKVFVKKNIINSGFLAISGILPTFLLVFGTSMILYDHFNLIKIDRVDFSIFMASGFSLTAFPMLARILQERNLSTKRFGVISLLAASIDDIVAWILLAVVTIIIQAGDLRSCLYILFKLSIFMAFSLCILKPVVYKLILKNEENIQSKFTIGLVVFLLCVFSTEYIGIHAVFGGFIAGLIIPKKESVSLEIKEKLEDFVIIFLVPIFFMYTGLQTRLDIFSSVSILGPLVIYLIVATIGKYVACTIATRILGFSWRDASAVGALMNARGLMILMFGNIGITSGLMTTEIFSIIVVTAIVTTASTYPIFNLSYPLEQKKILIRNYYKRKKEIS
ncbi:cation:proton antiporter [Bacillus cereus group sp. BfR-BA-01430]